MSAVCARWRSSPPRLNAIEGRVEILAPAILTRMLDIAELGALFVIDVGKGPDGLLELDVDREASRTPRTSRPRAGSLQRLSTGT